MDPPRLHKLDCGYTKLTPQQTNRMYKLRMRCKTCHCQAMQDHITTLTTATTKLFVHKFKLPGDRSLTKPLPWHRTEEITRTGLKFD